MTRKELRAVVLERDGHKCVRCGGQDSRGLCLHHREYVAGRNGPKPHDEPSDLVTLCRKCHGQVHHEDLKREPVKFTCNHCGWSKYRATFVAQCKCQSCGKLAWREKYETRRSVITPIELCAL